VEARVVEDSAAVQVAQDAHVVGAVPQQLLPLVLLRQFDGLESTTGLYRHLVVLAEQI
jgi:hypothetical protein